MAEARDTQGRAVAQECRSMVERAALHNVDVLRRLLTLCSIGDAVMRRVMAREGKG